MMKRATVLLAQDCIEFQCTSQLYSSGKWEWVRTGRKGREVANGDVEQRYFKSISLS